MVLKLSTWWKEEDKTPLIIQQRCLVFHTRKIPLQQTARGSQIAFVLDQWNIVIKNIFLAMMVRTRRWSCTDFSECTSRGGRGCAQGRLQCSSLAPWSRAQLYSLLQRPWLHKIVLLSPIYEWTLWSVFLKSTPGQESLNTAFLVRRSSVIEFPISGFGQMFFPQVQKHFRFIL